jgi:hypothetical protein
MMPLAYSTPAGFKTEAMLVAVLARKNYWDVFVTSDGKKGRMIRTDSGTTGVRTFEQ